MTTRILSILFFVCAITTCIQAEDKWSTLRINSLLPHLDSPLAVEPAVPADFVAKSPKGTLDVHEWIYWGPKDVLEAYFQNPASLSRAIIRVKLSESIKQIGPGKFNEENDELVQSFAALNLKRMYDIKRSWGRYPLYILSAQFPEKWIHAAWVGLDDGAGSVLMFELIYPKDGATQEDYNLWNDLFANTKVLPEPFYSHGYQLQHEVGATHLELYGAKVKVVGQARNSDNMIQIIVDPTGSGMQFQLGKVSYEIMAPNHALGGPAARVRGVFTRNDGASTMQSKQEIVVLIKPVDAFSIEQDTAKAKGYIVYEEKLPSPLKEYVITNP